VTATVKDNRKTYRVCEVSSLNRALPGYQSRFTRAVFMIDSESARL